MDQAQLPAGHRPAEHRVERCCDSCGQWDRGPRHHHVDGNGKDHIKHLDCCAADGCPIPVDHPGACHNLLAKHNYVKDDELVAALTSAGPLDNCPDEHEARRLHRVSPHVTDDHLETFLKALRAVAAKEA